MAVQWHETRVLDVSRLSLWICDIGSTLRATQPTFAQVCPVAEEGSMRGWFFGRRGA